MKNEDLYINALISFTGGKRAAANWIVQYQGLHNGKPITSIIGVIEGETRHPITVEKNFQQEVQCGELIMRVRERYTDGDHAGYGLAGLITDQAHPSCWKYAIKNGILVPNTQY